MIYEAPGALNLGRIYLDATQLDAYIGTTSFKIKVNLQPAPSDLVRVHLYLDESAKNSARLSTNYFDFLKWDKYGEFTITVVSWENK